MKTYISTGIGDMVLLDSILTQEEKYNVSEIFWACRFGKCLIPLLEDNEDYPNLISQHIINDNIGKKEMFKLDPIAVPFWHFRPDFPNSFKTGLSLFNLNRNEVNAINASAYFEDDNRKYVGCSFIKKAKKPMHDKYILFHYPTSTRPRSDIAQIDSNDWKFINELSKEKNMKVIVISDSDINPPLDNFILFVNLDINKILDLCVFCEYFAGCDSFCSHFASKVLSKEKLFIKSHNQSIKQHILNSLIHKHFYPHSKEDVSFFYKNYLGY